MLIGTEFITDDVLINRLIVDFKLINSNESQTFYQYDDNSWRLSTYESEELEIDIRVLEKIPLISIESLIDIIITSDSIKDIAGASLAIYYRNFDNNKNYRRLLINKLKELNQAIAFEKKRVKICITETELFDATNKEEILNKKYEEVLQDSNFYKQISKEVKELLNK